MTPLASLLLCSLSLQGEESTRRYDLGSLMSLYTTLPDSFPLAQSHVLEFGNRYSGSGQRLRIDPSAWLELVGMLVDDHNGTAIEWSGLEQQPPSFGLRADEAVHASVAQFLGHLERELCARTRVEIAAIALDPDAPASPAWLSSTEAAARIESARASGHLVGLWNLWARPGAAGEVFENRTRELIVSPAVQIAQNAWVLDNRTGSVHEGVDIRAHAASLPGGLRLQLAFEQRRALAPVAERRLIVSGQMGSDERGLFTVDQPALLQSQPVVSFGFQLALDLAVGQAALVEARWESADAQLGAGRWLYVIQAQGGASSSLIQVPFGPAVGAGPDASNPHFLVLAAPSGLQAPRWPALPDPQRTRLGLADPGNSTPGWVPAPFESPEGILQAIEGVEPVLFQTRYLAGWVIGLYPGQPGDEYPRILERLEVNHRLAPAGRGSLSLAPRPGERLDLLLPLSLGRPALAYLLGCDLRIDDDQAEVATGAAVSVPEVHPALRGVIALLEPIAHGEAGLALSGRVYGTWLDGAPREARISEKTWIDVAPVSLFDWPLEGREESRSLGQMLGSPIGGGPSGSAQIRF
jgi:hypothetical protein